LKHKATNARTRARTNKVGAEKIGRFEVPATQISPAPPAARLLDALSSAERKQYPITTGVTDYFPDACAEVAHISYLGNQKHNPGEALHWARGKSMDHADCCGRHLSQRGTLDSDGIRHSAQLAWRALALLQEELENDVGYELPRGAKAPD